jgi:hypothetical protein
MNDITKYYSTNQEGGELPYFVGKQYGSGWLRTIGRYAFPILKRLGLMAADTASDVIMENKPFLPSLKERATEAVTSYLPQVGRMFKRPHKTSSKPNINKRRKFNRTIFSK